jgi:large subunit ribosomal protein L4
VADVKAKLFASDGSAKGDFDLDADIFGIEPNLAVLHQVVTAQLAARRRGSASTKTRAEVRGGGRKPWRQKGLGRARQGSIRAPHWVGGGVAHGPKPRDYTQRTPKKMKKLALRSALSARASEGGSAGGRRPRLGSSQDQAGSRPPRAMGASGKTLLVISSIDSTAGRSFRNLPEVRLTEPGRSLPTTSSGPIRWCSPRTRLVPWARPAATRSEEDFIKDDASSSGEGHEGGES